MANMFLVILKFILMVVESRSSWQQFAFISKCPQYLLLHYMIVCVVEREREGAYVCMCRTVDLRYCGPAVAYK